jgi:hypothetical protein
MDCSVVHEIMTGIVAICGLVVGGIVLLRIL